MNTVSDFMKSEFARNEAVKFLGHLTVEELQTRVATLAALGKKTAAAIEAGNVGEVIGSHVRRGSFVDTHANVAGLNIQRQAWAQAAYVLKLKTNQ